MEYRLYLLDPDRHICAAHSFQADHDEIARETASVIFDARDDAVHGYELWHGAAIIASDQSRRPSERLTFATIFRIRQAIVRQHEEVMRDSFLPSRQQKVARHSHGTRSNRL